jgi:hypothetical protein
MWKRSVIVLVFGSLAVGALMILGDSHFPAQAAQPPVAPRSNPFSTSWLAAYHGLFDNIWTAEYESRGQVPAQARSTSRSLSSLISPLQPNADVRMSNPSFNTEQNEFQIDINPTNSQYAIGTSNDYQFVGVGIYRTSDGGASWTAFDAPIGISACCDPGVAYAYDGSVYVCILDVSPFVTYVIRSTDNGVTWSAPTNVQTNDRPNIVVDNGISSPRRGTVYLTYTDENAGAPGSNRVKGYKSTDAGLTWSSTFFVGDVISPTGFEQGSQPRVASDGTLYVGYQQYTDINAGCGAGVQNTLAKSTDGGDTWSYTVLPIRQGGVCTPVQNGRGLFCFSTNGTFRSRSSPIIGVSPTNPQHVYMLYSGGDLEDPYTCANLTGYHSDILFRNSTDGGATFSAPARVNNDPPGKDQYYPWMTVTANGTIWAGWHDRREDPNDYMHRWYESYSTDEGASWHKLDGSPGNEPIAGVMSLPFSFIGDYAGLGAVGNTVLPMWWDSRVKVTGDPFTEVGPPATYTPAPTGTPTATLPPATNTATSTNTNTATPTNTAGQGTATSIPQTATRTATVTNTHVSTSPTSTQSPTPCPPVWSIVSSPNLSGSENSLYSVSGVSPSDIWAAGFYFYSAIAEYQTLIEHWNGTSWSVVPSPNAGSGTNFLLGVSAAAANDAWAVGYYFVGTTWRTLTQHWDGMAWSIVASPNANSQNNALWAVAARSPNDAWAVGYYEQSPDTRALIEHWDGTTWSIVTSPNNGANQNYLNAVAAISANDAWAVGYNYTNGDGRWLTLVQHWDGTAWSTVPSPNPGLFENGLRGVSVVSPTDIWAVGYYVDGVTNRTLTEHWNGTAWSVVASPNVGTGNNFLNAVSAQSTGDVWAVGYSMSGTSKRTLVEHWNGTAWSVVASPNATSSDNQLRGVAALSGNNVWAAGDLVRNGVTQTLAERYAPSCATPTATPTPCVLSFEDVAPGDWYYNYVQWMYCHGVISGYTGLPQCSGPGASCFKPGNNNTRGQMAKIVVLAFSFPIDTTGGPHFTDVLPGSTFYAYVETARNLNLASGYSDGTFRPNANITRGQLSKIAVNAAILADAGHWSLEDPPEATFEDVAVGSTFFRYIETAVSHHILSGYPCGIPPAGPCGTGNKPYFLPFNNATRAQISKIIYLAVTYTGP